MSREQQKIPVESNLLGRFLLSKAREDPGGAPVTDFYKRVALVCRIIPAGHVATYGQIARLCGKPRNSRQVGYGLKCRMEEEVPAYRVVNGQGYLSGAALFSEPGEQQRRLREEGVEVSETNFVDLKKYGWSDDEADVLWLQAEFERRGI